MSSIMSTQFEGQPVRRVRHDGEWWFSAVDIVGVLSDSNNSRRYWSDMKIRETQLYDICVQLKMVSEDGKQYKTDAVTFQGALRLIQSIPSKKAEPLKLKVAEWAKQKLEEIADPGLAVERAIETYGNRGYTPDWIQQRITGIGTRRELTDEWKDRGINKGFHYGNLTNYLHQGAFGLKPLEHKELKGIGSRSLRDHCTAEELALTNLVETACRSLHVENASHGYADLKQDAEKAGEVGATARNALETALGRSVVSKRNALEQMKAARSKKLG